MRVDDLQKKEWFRDCQTNNCGLILFDIFAKPKGTIKYVNFGDAGYGNPVLFVVNNKLKVDNIGKYFQKDLEFEEYNEAEGEYDLITKDIDEHGEFHELYRDDNVTIYGFIPFEMEVLGEYKGREDAPLIEIRCEFVEISDNIDILYSLINSKSADMIWYNKYFKNQNEIAPREKLSLISINHHQYDRFYMDKYLKHKGYYQLLHYSNTNSANGIMVYLNKECKLWQR